MRASVSNKFTRVKNAANVSIAPKLVFHVIS